MAQSIISGPGQYLPYPIADYPNYPAITSVSSVLPTNFIDLAPGTTYTIPAGNWSVYIGQTCTLQIFDPVLLTWRAFGTTQLRSQDIRSDGVNWRVANLSGCAIGAEITTTGSGYTTPPTVTASAGTSTWTAVVGGAINTTVTITSAGAGYTVPPLLAFQRPPAGGVPATAYAVLTAGAITSVVVTTQGAGYTSVPTIKVIPSPQDPNLAGITDAVLTPALTGAGAVTAVLCTGNGAALANSSAGSAVTPPTLTFSSGSAAATAIVCQTIVSVTVSGGGTGYPNLVYATTVGGRASPTAIYRNAYVGDAILDPPRPAQMSLVGSGGVVQQSGQIIYDSGLFTDVPSLQVLTGYSSIATGTIAALAPVMGGGHGVVYLQPL